MKLHLCADTCVWLDLVSFARTDEQDCKRLLAAIKELLDLDKLSLIVPPPVFDEFVRNKNRVIESNIQSISSKLRSFKEIVTALPHNEANRDALIQSLDIGASALPGITKAAQEAVDKISHWLFTAADQSEPSDAAMLRAGKRALQKEAPCHRNKNSYADAVILEYFVDCLNAEDQPENHFAFVTHNKDDFCQKDGDERQPHPDIAEAFKGGKASFHTSLWDALAKVKPDINEFWQDLSAQNYARPFAEVQQKLIQLVSRLRYDRYLQIRARISSGQMIVSNEDVSTWRRRITPEEWEATQREAKGLKERYDIQDDEALTPMDWQTMYDKVRVLQWVAGQKWED